MAFGTVYQMKDHIYRIHEQVKESYPCTSCEKIFITKYKLKTHVKLVHEGIKNHSCEYCGKCFAKKFDMKKHIDAVHLKKPNVWKRKSTS